MGDSNKTLLKLKNDQLKQNSSGQLETGVMCSDDTNSKLYKIDFFIVERPRMECSIELSASNRTDACKKFYDEIDTNEQIREAHIKSIREIGKSQVSIAIGDIPSMSACLTWDFG